MKAFEDLRLFDHLSRSRHFGRTAAECHVSPSSLSRSIARLEADVGARLFDRDSRTVSLNPEGVRFAGFVAEVLAAWERFTEGSSGEAPEITGTVALFCTVTASQSIVPQMLTRFRAAHSGIELVLETGYAAEALDRLETGSVDVTVAPLPARAPRHLLAHAITSTRLVFVARPGSAVSLPGGPGGWADVPLVLPSSGLSRALIDRWFRRHRVRPTIAAEAVGHEAVLSLVSLGCGVGVVPDLVARQSVLAGDLEMLSGVEPPLPGFDIAVCTTADLLRRPAVAALWSSLTTSV